MKKIDMSRIDNCVIETNRKDLIRIWENKEGITEPFKTFPEFQIYMLSLYDKWENCKKILKSLNNSLSEEFMMSRFFYHKYCPNSRGGKVCKPVLEHLNYDEEGFTTAWKYAPCAKRNYKTFEDFKKNELMLKDDIKEMGDFIKNEKARMTDEEKKKYS